MIFSELIWQADSRESRRQANRLHDSPYVQHQALWALFQAPAGSPAPFLFRHQDTAPAPTFWMLSHTQPRDDSGQWRIRSRAYAPQLAEGDLLHFQLRANPSISLRPASNLDGQSRGVRTSLIGHVLAQQASDGQGQPQLEQTLCDWLSQRGERNGFCIQHEHAHMLACAVEQPQHWRFRGKQGRPLTLAVADFHGVLRISDAERFTACINNGLGHGKRFGLGMWMLRRAQA